VNFFFVLLVQMDFTAWLSWGGLGVDERRRKVVFVVVKKARRHDRRKIDLLCLRVVLTKPRRPEAQKWRHQVGCCRGNNYYSMSMVTCLVSVPVDHHIHLLIFDLSFT
jgi:hypothetical protein